MKEETLAAAWKSGGYCLTSISVISQLPYVGALVRQAESLGDWICGS